MKIRFASLFLAFVSVIHGETVGIAPNGKFEIDQKFNDGWAETIKFNDSKLPIVNLEAFPWPGFYSISPDGKWILRIQKSGSGSNLGFLYRIESNGRVSQIINFDNSLWKISDAHSRLKTGDLYHTGIDSASWTKDGHSLILSIRGSNSKKSEDGITSKIEYDMRSHTFSYLE